MYELVELAIARYRDIVERQSFDKLNNSFRELLLTEAQYRRAKKTQLIIKRAKFECQLKQFEFIYNQIKKKNGDMPEIEKFLKQIQQEIEHLKKLKDQE